MASKFDIHVDIPDDASLPPRARMYDDDQDETTAWVQAPLCFRGQDPATIFAACLLRSQEIQEMVSMAQHVAYAVYLGDEHYDIHALTPEAAQALVDQAFLQIGTPEGAPRPSSPRRM